jgi:hypothetical protein
MPPARTRVNAPRGCATALMPIAAREGDGMLRFPWPVRGGPAIGEE